MRKFKERREPIVIKAQNVSTMCNMSKQRKAFSSEDIKNKGPII